MASFDVSTAYDSPPIPLRILHAPKPEAVLPMRVLERHELLASGIDGALVHLIDVRHQNLNRRRHRQPGSHTDHQHRIADPALRMEPAGTGLGAFRFDRTKDIFQKIDIRGVCRQKVRSDCPETGTELDVYLRLRGRAHACLPF